MPKESAFLKRVQAKMARDRWLTVQQCQDIAMIALNREFGFGPERMVKFRDAYKQAWTDYADLCITDSKDDKAIVYTKDKVDRELKRICGPYFEPWEERYK